LRYVADVVLRQFNGDDFMRVGIDAEMQFAPAPRGTNTTLLIQPLALAVDLQTSAVDEEMQRFVATKRLWWNRQPAPSAAQCRVVGNCNFDVEQSRDRSQQSFSLTQRLVEHQAKRERGLDGYCRIDRLTATLSSRRSVPCRDGLIGKPNRQLSPPRERCIIVWPIRHSVSRLWELVAATLIELVWHGLPKSKHGTTGATLPAGRRCHHPPPRVPLTVACQRLASPDEATCTKAAAGGGNVLSQALRALGRIERTLFTLQWLSDPALRQRSHAGFNKGEASNALRHAVFFHRQGEIRDRTFENQSFRASGLSLITAAIVHWNTVYLDRAVRQLRAQGGTVPDDLLAHVAPLGWEHIGLTGDYVWTEANPAAPFRPPACRCSRCDRWPAVRHSTVLTFLCWTDIRAT
jgi:hypothetical protein